MTSPATVQKIEKELQKEAQTEEKRFQHAVKDLNSVGKSEAKAAKAESKAEKSMHKSEKKEADAAKLLHKATHNHDVAVSGLHSSEADLQTRQQQVSRAKQHSVSVRQHVDQLAAEKDEHARLRDNKLQDLRSSTQSEGSTSMASPAGAMPNSRNDDLH